MALWLVHHNQIMSVRVCLNVCTTPLGQWGFRQCLLFSWTTLTLPASYWRNGSCRYIRAMSFWKKPPSVYPLWYTKYTFQMQTQRIEETLAVVEAVQCTLMHFGHNHYSLLFEVKFWHHHKVFLIWPNFLAFMPNT